MTVTWSSAIHRESIVAFQQQQWLYERVTMLYVHCLPCLFLEQTPVALNILSVLPWQHPVHTNKRTRNTKQTKIHFFAKNEIISMLKRWICKRHYGTHTGNICFHTSKERNEYFKHWICEIGLNVCIIDVWPKI